MHVARRFAAVLGVRLAAMKIKVEKETIRIRSVADLYGVIEYIHTMYGVEETKPTMPDGLPIVCATFWRRTLKGGRRTTQLILSDEWPRGAKESKTYEVYRIPDDRN